jgi:uncharacterized OsmC-like protein
MSELRHYLKVKKDRLAVRDAEIAAGTRGAQRLEARVTAEGRTGVRRIRVGNHQIVMDSGPDMAGYDLGPGSQPLMLGVLGSCLTHVFLMQAARLDVALDELEVVVTATQDPRGGRSGFEDVPIFPHDISYVAYISSPHSEEEIAELRDLVEATCPLYNLFRAPVVIKGSIVHTATPR